MKNPPVHRFILSSFLLLALALQSCQYRIAIASPFRKTADTEHRNVNFATTDFSNYLNQAKQAGRPVFIDFYTSWCGPCRVMDRDVFTDSKLAAHLNEHFINLKINAEKGEGVALAKQFGVGAYPTLVFLDENGIERARSTGFTTSQRLLKMAR